MSASDWFTCGLLAGAWLVIGAWEVSTILEKRKQKIVPACEHLRVPLGFSDQLRQRGDGKEAKYVQLEGRWLVPVDDVTRVMTIEAERLSSIGARAEAYTCQQVAEWFSTDVLEIELRQMGGES